MSENKAKSIWLAVLAADNLAKANEALEEGDHEMAESLITRAELQAEEAHRLKEAADNSE